MASSSSELISLIDRIANGDRRAFAEAYVATSAKLYGILLRILRNRERADDVLQEVYIKLWQRAGNFKPEKASPMTWLCTIARNSAIDEIRRVRPVMVETDYTDFASDRDPSPADSAEISQELSMLNECLDRLGNEQRIIIKKAYLDGYTGSELAEISGKPLGTIKSWLRRGLMQLRDCLNS